MFSQDVINAVRPAVSKPVDFRDITVVLANLVFMHQVIKASESLIEEAIQHSTGELNAYLVDHLEQERAHEKWLSDDLLSNGIDVAKVPPIRKAVEMAGSQYYLVKHVSPFSLLGYMAVLEGFPVALETVEAMEAMHGKDLLKTLRYHAEHDLEHRKELFALIDKHPMPEIMQSATHTARYISGLADDLNSGELWKFIKDAT